MKCILSFHCCEPWSKCWLVLGGFTHLLDVGIDLRAMEFLIGFIRLKCPFTLYYTFFQMIVVVIYNVYSDCKVPFSRNHVSLRLTSDPFAKGALHPLPRDSQGSWSSWTPSQNHNCFTRLVNPIINTLRHMVCALREGMPTNLTPNQRVQLPVLKHFEVELIDVVQVLGQRFREFTGWLWGWPAVLFIGFQPFTIIPHSPAKIHMVVKAEQKTQRR